MSDNVYTHADKAIKRISVYIRGEFQNWSTKTNFDELNVIETREQVDAIYNRIDKVVRAEYKRMGQRVYREAIQAVKDDNVSLSVWPLILLMLKGYNATTDFVYTREWKRKRDRMIEAILATTGGGGNTQAVRKAIKRGVNLLANQTGQYADLITDAIRNQVFLLAGFKEVIWNTQQDGRVCSICQARDGQIYPINSIPPKHWHCRCWFTPIP